MTSGRLIVFEGVDGSGKTTQWRLLTERLLREDYPVLASCEPTYGPWGQKIRRELLRGTAEIPVATQLYWFRQDRREHNRGLIEPALRRGELVVLDRYYYSTVAYQGTLGGSNPQTVLDFERELSPAPTICFLLTLEPEVAFQRIMNRGLPATTETFARLLAVTAAYAALEDACIVWLDARHDVDTLHTEVWQHLCTRGIVT